MNMPRMATLKAAVLACAVLAITGAVAAPSASAQVAPSSRGRGSLLLVPISRSREAQARTRPRGAAIRTAAARSPSSRRESQSGRIRGHSPRAARLSSQPAGTTASGDASFTIVSGATTITGTKTIGTLPNMINQGLCSDVRRPISSKATSSPPSPIRRESTRPNGSFEDSRPGPNRCGGRLHRANRRREPVRGVFRRLKRRDRRPDRSTCHRRRLDPRPGRPGALVRFEGQERTSNPRRATAPVIDHASDIRHQVP